MSLWKKLDKRFNTVESGNTLWANEYRPKENDQKPHWSVDFNTQPTSLGLGFQLNRQFGDAYNWEDQLGATLHVGPWFLTVSRMWNWGVHQR